MGSSDGTDAGVGKVSVGWSGEKTDASVVEAVAGNVDVAGMVEVVRVGRFLEAGMLALANGFLCFIYALFNVTLYLVECVYTRTHQVTTLALALGENHPHAYPAGWLSELVPAPASLDGADSPAALGSAIRMRYVHLGDTPSARVVTW